VSDSFHLETCWGIRSIIIIICQHMRNLMWRCISFFFLCVCLFCSRQPSKQHTRSKKRDAHPPRLSNDNKPQTEDSVSSQQAEPDPRTKQSPPATAPQSQSTLIQKSSDAADSGETCLICAESIKYFALGSCSHRTCHICSIRMRALYKKRECALCKV
jgi:hypothetical protein